VNDDGSLEATMRIRVGIVFGGKSSEHEVSLQSAKSIYDALDRERYEPVLLGIDRKGVWHLGPDASFFLNASDPKRISMNGSAPAVVAAEAGPGSALALRDSVSGVERGQVDVFFPIVHGTLGEDGSLQGLLRLLDAPYVGASVLGSAIGMDKDVMKRLLGAAGLPTARYVVVRSAGEELGAVTAGLGFPLFVKPANLGSSVGVTRVTQAGGLEAAVRHALQFDQKVLVEEAVSGREIEVAVLGNRDPVASVCGEVVPRHEFYSYQAKYLDEQGALLHIPAPLDAATSDRIRAMAVRAFQVLECEGMGRVDFFLRPDLEPVVNEINTLPGFTRISMYPKLWQATGLPYPKLLDRLIELAIERHQRERKLRRSAD
jgi:D-alanine-D-alanine ligase